MKNNISFEFGPLYKKYEVGKIEIVAKDKPLVLSSGKKISSFPIAYQTYGKLNSDKSNAILVCHGLTGDQYLIGKHPITGKSGWWEKMVGDGKTIDTKKYFVICSNNLGGCLGSYGPKYNNPETNEPWALDFPVITISDMVKAQKLLIESMGIKKLFSVIGGSMGGMQVLEWASSFPNFINSAIPIAAAPRHTAQNIAFHEIGRQAIMADPDWCDGDYIKERKFPAKGLAVARMTAHVTYLSESGLASKFGRELQDRENISYGFEADFKIESYLRHQGASFVNRFDPNSYLYITRALDYFDLISEHDGELRNAFKECNAYFCIISFTSDWLFPAEEAKHVVHALAGTGANVSFIEIKTDKGHDAFLLDEPQLFVAVKGFLNKVENKKGSNARLSL